MKKLLFGCTLLLAGTVSSAVLLALTMAQDMTVNGVYSFSWNLSQFGLTPALILFAIIAVAGLGFSLWGLLEKK